MKLVIPAQSVTVDTRQGVEPVWYEKFALLFKSLGLFVERGAYSEGVYVPVLTAPIGTTPPTFTNPALTGRYIKSGGLVMVQVIGANTAGGTPGAGSGQLSLSLPRPVTAASFGGRIFLGAWSNAGAESTAFGDGAASASSIALYKQAISGVNSNQVPLTGADFNNASRAVSWIFTYLAD